MYTVHSRLCTHKVLFVTLYFLISNETVEVVSDEKLIRKSKRSPSFLSTLNSCAIMSTQFNDDQDKNDKSQKITTAADRNERSSSPIYIPTGTSGPGIEDEDNKYVPDEPTAAAVLSFLKSRGLSKAVVEFHQFLEKEKEDEKTSNKNSSEESKTEVDASDLVKGTIANNTNKTEDIQTKDGEDESKEDEEINSMIVDHHTSIVSRTELKFNISTGGGLGYDADYMPSTKLDHPPLFDARITAQRSGNKVTGGWDIERFVHSFTTLQTWVLQQPDDPSTSSGSKLPRWKAPHFIKTLISEPLHVIPTYSSSVANISSDGRDTYSDQASYPPPTIKPELLSICFPILVHSYCALLESGMEDVGCELWKTWKSLYSPLYPQDVIDLDKLNTTKKMKEFYDALLVHSELIQNLKGYKTRDIELQISKKKLFDMKKPSTTIHHIHQIDQKLMIYEQESIPLQKTIKELTEKINTNERMLDKYPFLYRMKSKKYQIHMSAHTWRKLSEFLTRESLAPMYGILQLHCRIIVEARDPLPFSPFGILEEDQQLSKVKKEKNEKTKTMNETKELKRKSETQINWAAPVHPSSRAVEMGKDPSNIDAVTHEKLPFPKFYPQDEEKKDSNCKIDENVKEDESRRIAFNRALRINGFRRLEALEIVQEYESGMRAPSSMKNNAYPGSVITQKTQRGAMPSIKSLEPRADPHSPSILMATCCSGKSISSSSSAQPTAVTISSNKSTTPHSSSSSVTLEESGIGITCASMSPLDGRRIAAGCEDAAVRIFALDGASSSNSNKESMDTSITPGFDVSDSEMLLIGHKNGSPVFDLCWNRDGRNLLSAGGDGTIRLWDTMAVGPYGKLSNVRVMKKGMTQSSKAKITPSKISNPNVIEPVESGGPPSTNISGSKSESLVQAHGAALTVYSGHTVNTPVWSCEFAPSGYYFASTGADCTGRIWTTDCPQPVRILAGHYSSVNCVTWHPNCNYVLTGSDDKTVRMWDIQSGKCVRVLAGSYSSLNVVKVSPSGRYAAAADIRGIIGLWDLDSGRKVNEFQGHNGEIHSLSYSACGSALASGGDDCTVKIWDARGAGVNTTVPEVAKAFDYNGVYGEVNRSTEVFEPPGTRKPVNTFLTKQTMILDLHYTKRNLLMGVGKYVNQVGSL